MTAKISKIYIKTKKNDIDGILEAKILKAEINDLLIKMYPLIRVHVLKKNFGL